MNASCEAEFYVAGACGPTAPFIGNVILHASVHVNLKFDLLDRSPKTRIILSCIFVIGVVFGVVNMLLRPVDAQTFFRDLKFLSGITKGQKTQDPDLETSG